MRPITRGAAVEDLQGTQTTRGRSSWCPDLGDLRRVEAWRCRLAAVACRPAGGPGTPPATPIPGRPSNRFRSACHNPTPLHPQVAGNAIPSAAPGAADHRKAWSSRCRRPRVAGPVDLLTNTPWSRSTWSPASSPGQGHRHGAFVRAGRPAGAALSDRLRYPPAGCTRSPQAGIRRGPASPSSTARSSGVPRANASEQLRCGPGTGTGEHRVGDEEGVRGDWARVAVNGMRIWIDGCAGRPSSARSRRSPVHRRQRRRGDVLRRDQGRQVLMRGRAARPMAAGCLALIAVAARHRRPPEPSDTPSPAGNRAADRSRGRPRPPTPRRRRTTGSSRPLPGHRTDRGRPHPHGVGGKRDAVAHPAADDGVELA